MIHYHKSVLVLTAFLFLYSISFSQNPYNLQDGRNGLYCRACEEILNKKPKEVLFGVNINSNGDVYFIMDNREWFDELFSKVNGITVDVVPKSVYNCDKEFVKPAGVFKGFVLPPLFKQNFKANMQAMGSNTVSLKVGKAPPHLLGQELEGSLVLLNGNFVCLYRNFINIPRSNWEMLPMGLYTDTLLNTITSSFSEDRKDFFTYTGKLQAEVLFPKGKTSFNEADIKRLYDSLRLKGYIVKKMEVRAYSSVEGSYKVNQVLMQNRAKAMINAMKQYHATIERTKIIASENWLEFLNDIKTTKYAWLHDVSKLEIKQKLTDTSVAKELEPILARHRKAIVTVYVESKSAFISYEKKQLESAFNSFVKNKQIDSARIVLKEMAERIADSQLPENYLNELEVPEEALYVPLLNDRAMYQYLLLQTSEYQALELLKRLRNLDPENGKIQYNICALTLFALNTGDTTVNASELVADITKLPRLGIDPSLTNRMLVNYNILLASYYLGRGEYQLKDQCVFFIRDVYLNLRLTDEDVYSLAKFFAYHSQFSWAEAIVEERTDKLDVNENL
ncbi:MAG: hypothetical protein K2X48_15795 [Chitinophagaceae bacterium]|nr:hypothetical protein [Chitinophagaceae bacterium]